MQKRSCVLELETPFLKCFQRKSIRNSHPSETRMRFTEDDEQADAHSAGLPDAPPPTPREDPAWLPSAKQPLRPLAAFCLGMQVCRQQVAGSLVTTIAAVDPEGPAHRSGKLQPGDCLLSIDGTYCLPPCSRAPRSGALRAAPCSPAVVHSVFTQGTNAAPWMTRHCMPSSGGRLGNRCSSVQLARARSKDRSGFACIAVELSPARRACVVAADQVHSRPDICPASPPRGGRGQSVSTQTARASGFESWTTQRARQASSDEAGPVLEQFCFSR